MRGVVALEFIVAFPAIILFLMGVFQIMHGQVARMLADQAAHRAARAASLWLTELEADHISEHDARQRIRLAAAQTMVPVAPPTGRATPLNLGGDAMDAVTPHRAVLAMAGAGNRPDQRRMREKWSADLAFDADLDLDNRGPLKMIHAIQATRIDDFTLDHATGRAEVTIEYAYHCPFPVAGLFYCSSMAELPGRWPADLARIGLSLDGRYRIIRARSSFAVAPRPENG